MKFTSVVSLHTNTYGCGVAKFSAELAQRLNVPLVPLSPDPQAWGSYPLLSLKWSELHPDHQSYTRFWCHPTIPGSSAEVMRSARAIPYGVFWHDAGDPYVSGHAAVVFYADPSLGPNGLWCPSLLEHPTPRPLKLFSFGMAHKIQTQHYARVRDLLDDAGICYHLRVSVGLHEGTDLREATKHFDALKDILGPEKVTILGILSDAAVNLELQACDHVLAFFEKGVRANNTTVHAALQAGKSVFTNHDAQTPGFLKAATKDIVTRQAWESSIPYHYSWDNLLKRMHEIYDATLTDRQPSRL